MLVHTVNFGPLEVPEEKIIEFRDGLPGFSQIRRFAVLELEDLKPFRYLQSLGDPPIALLIIDPYLVDREYKLRVSQTDMEDILAAEPGNVTVYAVATVPDNPEEASVNLMAPVLINEKTRRGKQAILLEAGYPVRHPLFNKHSGSSATAGAS